MSETREAKRRRLVNWYRVARAQVARLVAAGSPVLDSARWELVNAQHALAEFTAEAAGKDGTP